MHLENAFDDFVEGGEDEILVALADPGGLDEEGGGAGEVGGLSVLPFVADDAAAFEVEVPLVTKYR